MAEYIAAIFEEDGLYGVAFPDFPGCVTSGASLEEARRMAEEALELHIRGMHEDGEDIPRPSGLAEAKASELAAEASAFFAIKGPELKMKRITITMPQDVVDRLDAHLKAIGAKRSTFLTRVVESEIALHPEAAPGRERALRR